MGGATLFGRSVRRMAVMAVVLIVAAESCTPVSAARLPTPLTWFPPVAKVKADQMAGMQAGGTQVEVVLTGTSQMAEGADPVLFRQLADHHPPTYNAAILAGYPPANRRFVPEEV